MLLIITCGIVMILFNLDVMQQIFNAVGSFPVDDQVVHKYFHSDEKEFSEILKSPSKKRVSAKGKLTYVSMIT